MERVIDARSPYWMPPALCSAQSASDAFDPS